MLLKYKKRDKKRELCRIKVAFVHNTIAPYRHALFERLSGVVDLIVYYCTVKHASRKWDLWPRSYNYKYKILARIPIRTPIGELNLNPTIINEMIRNKPNIVVIGGYVDPTNWLAFIIAKIFKIPIIHWTEGIREPRSILGIITKPVRMFFVKNSDAIVVPGKKSKNYVISLGIIEEKVFVAPNAIDNDLFIKVAEKYRACRNSLKGDLGFENRIVILSVGQLIERKGFKYLLQAYSRIEKEHGNTALIICGSGPLKGNLMELANRLSIKNFRMIESGLGFDHLIMLYSIADIFVLPTLEDMWGFVINEAMACGLPVISTHASQAATEMICSGENGYIIKEGSSEELYIALRKLISNAVERERMGFMSRAIAAKKFDVSRTVDGFLSAIEYASRAKR